MMRFGLRRLIMVANSHGGRTTTNKCFASQSDVDKTFEDAKKHAEIEERKRIENHSVRIMLNLISKGVGSDGHIDQSKACLDASIDRWMRLASRLDNQIKQKKLEMELMDPLVVKCDLLYYLGDKITEPSIKIDPLKVYNVITLADLIFTRKANVCKVIGNRDGEFRFPTFNTYDEAHQVAIYAKRIKDVKEDVFEFDGFSFIVVFFSFKACILKVKRLDICPPFALV